MLVVGVVLALAQQFVGVNTVIYYAPTILSDTGLSNSASLANTVVVGVTNVVFIASFAIGLGPVFWLMISEIFPIGARSKAMAVCTIVNWGANFVVAQTFLSLGSFITRQGVFYLYAVLAAASLVFFIMRVPETRGRTLEEVQKQLTGSKGT